MMSNLKESIKAMIASQRGKENQKINMLRKMKRKQLSHDEQTITEIRTKIAEDLKKEFQKGDGKACKPDATQKEINEICNKYYVNDGSYYDKC